MTPSPSAAPATDLSRRLVPSPTFDDASARVEAALDELRAAELSLERQLSALRRYIRAADPVAAPATAQAA